jgi:hypothetical protein
VAIGPSSCQPSELHGNPHSVPRCIRLREITLARIPDDKGGSGDTYIESVHLAPLGGVFRAISKATNTVSSGPHMARRANHGQKQVYEMSKTVVTFLISVLKEPCREHSPPCTMLWLLLTVRRRGIQVSSGSRLLKAFHHRLPAIRINHPRHKVLRKLHILFADLPSQQNRSGVEQRISGIIVFSPFVHDQVIGHCFVLRLQSQKGSSVRERIFLKE